MKAILIARVSTEEQREAGNSLPAQMARLERYCQVKGFTVLQAYSFDESAYTNNRSEFDRIIDSILEQKEKIAVCADKVDRLSRNVFDKRISLLYNKALIDQIELHFVSESQVITSRISAAEKFQFSISLGLAKYYSDAISDNVRRAMEQKLRNGEWLTLAPYGYKNVKKADGSSDIAVQDYESEIIKKVFELYASKAFSLSLLCEKLKNDYNIQWAKGRLAKVLKNKFYCGIMVIKGKEYPHGYPCQITKALYDECQAHTESFKKKPCKLAGRKPYMYRGLIRCGHCGLSVTPEQHKGIVYYHCTQYRGKHEAKWIREDVITKELSKIFKGLQLSKPILKEIADSLETASQQKIEFHKKETDKLLAEQKRFSKMLNNLYIDKLDGRITTSVYDNFYQSLSQQLSDVIARLEQLEEAGNNYDSQAKLLLEVLSVAHDAFASSKVESKRQIIKLVLSNLRIENESLLWDVVQPFDFVLKNAGT